VGVTVDEVRLDNGAAALVVGATSDEAVELARLGATVVLPASGIPIVGELAVDEAAIWRAVAVQRLSLDVLAARGAKRFGFFGHSGGGFQHGGNHVSPVSPLLLSSRDRSLAWAARRRDAAPPAHKSVREDKVIA